MAERVHITSDGSAPDRGVPLADIIVDPILAFELRQGNPGDVTGAQERIRQRRERLKGFSCAPRRRESHRVRTIRDRLIREIVETGDVIGVRGRDAYPGEAIAAGSVFMLVALSPEVFRMLVKFGAEAADLEEDDPDGDNSDTEESLGWPINFSQDHGAIAQGHGTGDREEQCEDEGAIELPSVPDDPSLDLFVRSSDSVHVIGRRQS